MSPEWILGALAGAGLLIWLLRPRRGPPREPWEGPDRVDRAELEDAERDVREADPAGGDPEAWEDDDWGPGAGGRR